MYFSGLPGENPADECIWQRLGVVTFRLDVNTNKAGVVTQLFATVLGRAPDQVAIDSAQSLNCSQIGHMVANSPEAHGIYASMDNPTFVSHVYHRILMRAPDAGGHAFYVNLLNSGVTRDQVVAQLVYSPEFKNWCKANYNVD